jgi:hypothetical protein
MSGAHPTRIDLGSGRSIAVANLSFLDIEASGLGPRSWPIEIGVAMISPSGTISTQSALIAPDPDWDPTAWSAESQAVHGISRAQLDAEGGPAPAVASGVLMALGHRMVVSDAPEFDERWLGVLLRTLAPTLPVPRLVDFDQLVATAFEPDAVDRVYRTLDALPAPHRAGPDAERLARAFLAGLTGE